MTAIKTVAVAGASGTMGSVALKALVDAGFTVTALTRLDSSATFPSGVKVSQVDYNNIESLTAALKDQDAVVSTVGYAGMQGQVLLVDAAVAAGVKRIIPSEYGRDPEDAHARGLPVFAHKVQVEDYLRSKVQGTSTTFTLVCNNEFFDWDLDHSFGVDIKNKKIEIFDGGDHSFTATPLPFVAQGIVGVLQHPDETANRIVRLHGTSMSQNKLLGLLQRYTSAEGWTVSHVNTADREGQGYGILQKDPSNMYAWAVAFLQCAVFGKGFRNDFSINNDNALLGLQELGDDEVEEIVRSRV
ncbi:hypothetical protein LTR56_014349 [Elasticomyces elasticus]|nr:hypothetical protein LTR56_014349 [Elasticomyces elasticus]KAK3636363.1 hypothetical protein LTR22_018739 [Elasticomyces elasticus]KAK4916605.1 hypothetical protein LTR49_015438 [Elasticomyces elasticus]KAK5756158.1 hypothetical protein LTS12_013711 [Elasticomyces elasticus]